MSAQRTSLEKIHPAVQIDYILFLTKAVSLITGAISDIMRKQEPNILPRVNCCLQRIQQLEDKAYITNDFHTQDDECNQIRQDQGTINSTQSTGCSAIQKYAQVASRLDFLQ